MKRLWAPPTARWLAVLLLTAMTAATLSGALLFATSGSALAAGDTLSLAITNGTSFTYGGTAPTFTAVVSFGVKPTTSPAWKVTVQIAGGESFANTKSPTVSADGMSLTFTGLHPASPVPAGAHSATAQFINPETSTTVSSNAVSFTVNKAGEGMACAPANGATLLGAGKPVNIQMATDSGSGSLPAEWLTGTFTVKLDGPTHATYDNLTATSAFIVTVTPPTQSGVYTLTCTFNGNANYGASEYSSNQPYTVSAGHALGTVQLYSNPTTLTAGQKIDFYVVFSPATGLPTPSGQFTLSFGSHHTNAFTLGSAGTFLIYFGTISSVAGVTDIQVAYLGDANYAPATLHFPLTNQPIPPGIDDGPGGTPQPTAATTAATTETPGDETATPTAVSTDGALTDPAADSGPNLGLLMALAAAIMLVLAIAGGAIILVVYRMRRGSADGDEQASYGYPATGYGRIGMGAMDANDPYRRSGQYRNPGQNADPYSRSGQYRQNGQNGQYGQTAQTARYPRPGQAGQGGQYGQTGKQRQPGQYGQSGLSGQTGRHRAPGQYGQSGLSGQGGQTGKYRRYQERGQAPGDDA